MQCSGQVNPVVSITHYFTPFLDTPFLLTYSFTMVHENHGITAVFHPAPRLLTLYLSSKQLRASGALGLNISGRYLRAKERLEASWVSP